MDENAVEQIVGHEPRESVSHEAFVDLTLALPRGHVSSTVVGQFDGFGSSANFRTLRQEWVAATRLG